jgi:hypothetical protein
MLMLEEDTQLASLGGTVNQLIWGMASSDFVGRSVNIQDSMKMFVLIELFFIDQFVRNTPMTLFVAFAWPFSCG